MLQYQDLNALVFCIKDIDINNCGTTICLCHQNSTVNCLVLLVEITKRKNRNQNKIKPCSR